MKLTSPPFQLALRAFERIARLRRTVSQGGLLLAALSATSAPCLAQSNPDSQGAKKVLVMMIDIREEEGGVPLPHPIEPSEMLTILQECNTWFDEVSGGRNSLDVSASDIYGWYDYPGMDESDARRLAEDEALAAGLDPSVYQRYILAYAHAGGSFAIDQLATVYFGTGNVGPYTMGFVYHRGVNSASTGLVLKHELGHTMTLQHANFMSGLTGTKREYGNSIDVMGGGPGMYSVANLEHLDWVQGGEILEVTTSGNYTLSPMELEGVGVRALKIVRPTTDGYQGSIYMEYRQPLGPDADLGSSPSSRNVFNGAIAYMSKVLSGKPRHDALDATPETRSASSGDFALMVGRTLVDWHAGIAVTGLAQDPLLQTFEVGVHFMAETPNNQPPTITDVTVDIVPNGLSGGYDVTLTATASDPNLGDTLSYFWNLGVDIYDSSYDGQMTGNGDTATGSQVVHHFSGAPKIVRLQVSDRKGGLSEWHEVPLFNHIIRVPADQPNLQAAVDAAVNGDVILVAAGTYSGTGNFNVDLGGKRIVVRSESGPQQTILDLGGLGRGFTIDSNETTQTVIDGFTIQGGQATIGGGILIQSCEATIQNCILRDNHASGNGGGFYIKGSNGARLINNVVSDNRAGGLGFGKGGGIYMEGNHVYAPLYILNNTIVDNSVSGVTGNGSGVHAKNLRPYFANTILWGNGPTGTLQVELATETLDPTFSYCCSPDLATNGTTNINENPLMSVNYGLSPYSPCIDHGGVAASLVDLYGNRRVDVAGHDNYEIYYQPNTSVSDIGAVEFIPAAPHGGGGGGKEENEQQH